MLSRLRIWIGNTLLLDGGHRWLKEHGGCSGEALNVRLSNVENIAVTITQFQQIEWKKSQLPFLSLLHLLERDSDRTTYISGV